MPFVAACPYCQVKVRVPDHVRGQSYPCPRCGDAFTLAPIADQPGPAEMVVHKPTAPRAAAAVMRKLSALAEAPPPDVAAAPTAVRAPRKKVAPAALAGGIALVLAALALPCLSLSALRMGAIVLGALAVLAALAWRFVASTRKDGRATAATGGVLGGVVLLIALLLPQLLSTRPPEKGPAPELPDPNRLYTIAIRGHGLEPAPEWPRADRCSVQLGDVRVRVMGATVRSEGPPAPGKAPEFHLYLDLRAQNVGTTQRFRYRGWGAPGALAAVLRSPKGEEVPLATPAADNKPPANRGVPPLGHLDDVLVFEAPPKDAEALRLELPAAAVGGTGTLRLEIPRSMLARP